MTFNTINITAALLFAMQAVLVATAADVSVWLGHVLLDNYADNGRGPAFLRSLARANQLHHARPLEFTKKSLFENGRETAFIGAAIVLLAWLVGVLTWHLWLYAALVGASSVFHRFQHLELDRVPSFIKLLQAAGLLQSRQQHAEHHRAHHSNYAILLPFTNPLLEAIHAPRLLKRAIQACCDAKALDIKVIAEALRREWKAQRI